jgi:hypothetical protein
MNTPREDLDSPWKDILRVYFPQAMQFFFPHTAVLIDWDRPYEFLDKELLQIAREAELGRRYADQLVKVWLLEGKQVWLLLHVEVQSQWESGFAQRAFVYNFRIFDLHQQVPVSLAILCDERSSWRPQNFVVTYPDTRLNFEFGTQTFEEERKVTYVTNAERIGFERGILEGEQRGKQVGIQEGEQLGRQFEGLNLIFRQLTRRLGEISPDLETKIRNLSLIQLEELGEALLDFSQVSDLEDWLRSHS